MPICNANPPRPRAGQRLHSRLHASLWTSWGGSGEAECAPPIDVVEHDDRIDSDGRAGRSGQRAASRVPTGQLVIAGREATGYLQQQRRISFRRTPLRPLRQGDWHQRRVRRPHAPARRSPHGELRIVLPRVEERRDRDIHVEVIPRMIRSA